MANEKLEQKENVSIRLGEEESPVTQCAEVSQVPLAASNYSPDFAGRFELLELIGEGGMGLVYKVRDPVLDKVFAVKVLRSTLTRDAQALKRFEKEASHAVGFDHPGLVAVYETGSLKDGTPFILMDHVDGRNLADILKQDGSLPLQRALQTFQQILDALNYVHEAGLMHRDVKPRNIILRTNDEGETEVKLVDFGIAKIAASGEATTGGVTQTGDFLGSPLYMSPEQCQGRELTAQSDIYSAGCVLYEMLTGHSPFHSPNPVKIVIGHLSEPVTPITSRASGQSTIWDGVNAMTRKCLEKTLDKRYQSVTQVQKDLSALMDNENPFAPVKTPMKYLALGAAVSALSLPMYDWLHTQSPETTLPTFLVSLVVFIVFMLFPRIIDTKKPVGVMLGGGIAASSAVLMYLSYRDSPRLLADTGLVAPLQILLVVLAGLSVVSTFKFAYHPESFFSKPSNALREVMETDAIKRRKLLFRIAILSTVLFGSLLSKMPESPATLISGGAALYVIALAALSGGSLAILKRLRMRESTLAGDRWLLLNNASIAVGLLFNAAGKAIAYLGSQFAISAVDAAQWEMVFNGLMMASLILAFVFCSIYRKRADSVAPFGKSDGW